MSSRAAEVQAGLEAERLVNDQAYVEAKERLRGTYFHQFEMSTTSEARDLVHARLAALNDLDGALRAAITTGKLAARETPRI